MISLSIYGVDRSFNIAKNVREIANEIEPIFLESILMMPILLGDDDDADEDDEDVSLLIVMNRLE